MFGRATITLGILVCLVLVLSRVSMSRHVSSRDCVLTVSLSGIDKRLFCGETFAFLAGSRPIGALARSLLTYRRTVFCIVARVCRDNYTMAMSESQTF